MGAWQMAKNKIARMQQYEVNFNRILIEILPQIDRNKIQKPQIPDQSNLIADTIVLIVGTERGLCGKFNESLANNALAWIDRQNFYDCQIWIMGSRLQREMKKKDVEFSWRKPLPEGTLFTYQEAYVIIQKWLEQYEAFEFNQFIILYNQIAPGGNHKFSQYYLLPYQIQHPTTPIKEAHNAWPPPIIETDPKGIYNQIIQHYIASSFYQILLKSAAAEHSARYNLMQEAKDNAEEIIEELNRVINAERKRQITQEMQELAVGAGLLDQK